MIKQICDKLQKPYFEVANWPAEELIWQAACIDIDNNDCRPTFQVQQKDGTVEESIANLKRVLSQ